MSTFVVLHFEFNFNKTFDSAIEPPKNWLCNQNSWIHPCGYQNFSQAFQTITRRFSRFILFASWKIWKRNDYINWIMRLKNQINNGLVNSFNGFIYPFHLELKRAKRALNTFSRFTVHTLFELSCFLDAHLHRVFSPYFASEFSSGGDSTEQKQCNAGLTALGDS